MTAISVLSYSRTVEDRPRSFAFCMGGSIAHDQPQYSHAFAGHPIVSSACSCDGSQNSCVPSSEPSPQLSRVKRSLKSALVRVLHGGPSSITTQTQCRSDGPNQPTTFSAQSNASGQPGLPTRLVAGLFILKHMHNLCDEVLCARWIENPSHGELGVTASLSSFLAGVGCRSTRWSVLCVPK
jgi:hypothetical protein